MDYSVGHSLVEFCLTTLVFENQVVTSSQVFPNILRRYLIRMLRFYFEWDVKELTNVKIDADEWYSFDAKSCRALNGIEPSRDKSQLKLFYLAWGSKDWLFPKNLSVTLSLIKRRILLKSSYAFVLKYAVQFKPIWSMLLSRWNTRFK